MSDAELLASYVLTEACACGCTIHLQEHHPYGKACTLADCDGPRERGNLYVAAHNGHQLGACKR
eukprot:19000-Heterococcus_DN1.PRE.1